MIYDDDTSTGGNALTPNALPYAETNGMHVYRRVLANGQEIVFWRAAPPDRTPVSAPPPKELIGRGWSAAKLRRSYADLLFKYGGNRAKAFAELILRKRESRKRWDDARLLALYGSDRKREEYEDRQRAKYSNKLNGLGKLTKALQAQGYTPRVTERRTACRFSPGPRRPCYRSR